jgi:hypothetical protein
MTINSKSQFKLFLVLFCCTNLVVCSWIISCKPCTSVLEKCKNCESEQSCVTCTRSLNNTKCENCFIDIFREKKLYCENSVNYQYLSCKVSCHAKEKLNGACDSRNGECKCGSEQFVSFLQSLDGLYNSAMKVNFHLISGIIIIMNIFFY